MSSAELEKYKAVIRQMLSPLKDIPLDVIIESICGHTIWQYDGFEKDCIVRIVDLAGKSINQNGISSKRPNEVGNYCEPHVVRAIGRCGYEADHPRTGAGKRRPAGYPDIEAQIADRPFYIEVKSYNPEIANTTFRSFYLSPSVDFKVTRDAYHLIFAFEMNERTPGIFYSTGCKILDAKSLMCDVKYEFNSDNRRMYAPDNAALIAERRFV